MDRNVWLASLHAGLEASFSTSTEQASLPPFMPPSPKVRGTKRNYCKSCGKLAYQIVLEGAPLPQYATESRQQVCPLCSLAQGVVLDVQRLNNLYHQQLYEQKTLEQAKKSCWSVVKDSSDEDVTDKLLALVTSPSFGTFRRVCPLMEQQCALLETLQRSPLEFLESLELESKEQEELGKFKKQALSVAGDMGSAMKLLQSCCNDFNESDEMLSYILEFFLDLCQEGELSSVAFFWPQLQCIHLRMLPPEHAQQLHQVELMEDFLLTVATKYSVQLALELVWGYSADLEDSLYNTNCSAACKRRRFSVLRFVCELESLLFDFEHGWGGGSVALKNMISPSPHQVTLLRCAMLQLQNCRQEHHAFLSRSVRRDKLVNAKFNLPPEEAAQEALRIARNADYFSSHLSYIRRLGDVAEKLRHFDLELRAPTLERELALLNSSGGMGGDPLNRIHENLIRVVRVPRKEGHVFRSKERTPVLLLMEVLEEGVEEEEEDSVSTKNERCRSGEAESTLSVNGSSKAVSEKSVDEDSGSTSEQAKGEGTGEAQSDSSGASDSTGSDYSGESEEYTTSQESKVSEEESVKGDSKANDSDASEAAKVATDSNAEGKSNEENGTGDSEESAEATAENEKKGTAGDDIYSAPLTSLDAELTDHHHSPRGMLLVTLDALSLMLTLLTRLHCSFSPWQAQAL